MIGIFVGIIFVISSEKLFSNEVIGDTADGPSGHIVVIFGGQSNQVKYCHKYQSTN